MDYDVIVIGAGPGGYTAACLCAKNGLKTAVIEKNKVGGVCLNVGCIPTKALIKIANNIEEIKKNSDIINIHLPGISINWQNLSGSIRLKAETVSKGVDYLLKINKVDLIYGKAEFTGKNMISVNGNEYKAKDIIIATGSRNKDISKIIKINIKNQDNILTNNEAVFLDKKITSIAILGGGAIGVEFAYILNQLGADVSLLEYFPNLLPNIDLDCSRMIERAFRKNNINILTASKITMLEELNDKYIIKYNDKNNTENSIEAEYILNALGRMPNTEDLSLENIGLTTDKGFITVDKNMQTSIDGIYAVGDVVSGSPQLAHVAYDEARTAVDSIIKKDRPYSIDYNYIPFCVYSEPQVAGFGLNEDKIKEKGIDYKIIKVFFKASGKAVAIDKTDGFIKLLIDKNNETIISASICGSDASEMIHEILVSAKAGLKLKAIVDTTHTHPTLSELIQDAAKEFYGEGLH